MSIDTLTATQILQADYQPPRMIAASYIAVGLNILAGNPKSGKSFLALKLAHSVATGNLFLNQETAKGKVLYLALEDTKYRIQNRMRGLGLGITDDLLFATAAPSLDEGTLLALNEWAAQTENAQMIVIDTLARVRSGGSSTTNVYQEDSLLGGALQALGFDNDIAVVVIHHMRKEGHKDFLLSLSGSAGLPGAADVVLGLQRKRNEPEAFLHITGRDISERVQRLHWSSTMGGWQV